MGRRICEFVNPHNGDIDWLEPDTVNRIYMLPKTVMNRNDEAEVYGVHWTNIDSEKVVVLYVTRQDSTRQYGIKMGEVEFAGMFAEVVYSHALLDSCNIIQEMIGRAICGYNGQEVFKGVLLHE